MELTDEQRAELAAIRERATPHWNQQQYQLHARPKGKDAYDKWQSKLDSLACAWRKLDSETQTQLLVTIVREWTDDEHPGVPDLAQIIDDLKDGVVLPTGQRELPGFRAAVIYLWEIWCKDQLGGYVEIESAIGPIAALIGTAYGLSGEDALTKVTSKLRGLANEGWLTRRPTARDEVKGPGLPPFP